MVIPPPQPSADSVSPNGSSGGSQTFTFVFSDTQSATNLIGMAMLFNTTSATVTNACDIVYDRNAGTVALTWDSGAGSDPKALGSSVVLKNSQCQVGAVTAAASGLSQIITLSITFTAAFSGTKNIYMYGSDAGLNTGWVLRGTYLVAAGGLPVANTVVPTSGSGPAQRFSFTASDQGGSGFITGMAMLLSTSLSTTNACSMVYDRTRNVVSLAFDNPANGAAPVTPGSPTIVSNGQCSLNGANTTVVIGVTSIVVTVDLTFNADWFGAKNTYLLASETIVNSGFVTVGGWTVTGGAPTADSVSPASGTGTSPNFTFTVSDSTSQLNITGMSMLITSGAPTSLANACYLVYNRVTGHYRPLRQHRHDTQHQAHRFLRKFVQHAVRRGLHGDDQLRQFRVLHHQHRVPQLSAEPRASTCRPTSPTPTPAGCSAARGRYHENTCPSTKTANKLSKNTSSAWAWNAAAWR